MIRSPQEQLAHVAVVADETARMARDFRSWPQSSWSRATFCPGWQAADAVAHLATGGDFYAQVLISGRSGAPQLPWGASDAAGARAGRAAASQKLIAAGPAALIEGFEQGAVKLQEVLDSLRPDELDKVAWHPRGLVPLGSWVGMRLNELVVHEWDIRQPHEADAGLSLSALPAMVAVLPEMQMQFLQQRASDDLHGVYVVQTNGTAWGFGIQDKTVTYHATAPAACDVRIQAEAGALILLTMGRVDASAMQQRGTLSVSGDAAKGQRFCDTLFRIF